MPFDPIAIAEGLENFSPKLAKALSMHVLGHVSPFNSHLKASLLEWGKFRVQIKLKCHRGVKNHVGSIHAGALFTLGETCAGLTIIRNFSFKQYRPLMSEVEVRYDKQARGPVLGECELSKDALLKAMKTLESEEIPFIPMKTIIRNAKGELVAEVKTTWQVKPWKKVRGQK